MAKKFRSGNSRAVRIPRSFHSRPREVEIFRRGDGIVPGEQPGNFHDAFRLLAELSADFIKGGRRQPKLDKR
jgi:antitoxin VapB